MNRPQAVKASLTKSHDSRCFTANIVLSAVELGLLLLAAAAYTAYLVLWRRRNLQRVRSEQSPAQQAQQAAAGVTASKAEAGAEAGAGAVAVAAAAPAEPEAVCTAGGGKCWCTRKVLLVETVMLAGGTMATMLGLGGGA